MLAVLLAPPKPPPPKSCPVAVAGTAVHDKKRENKHMLCLLVCVCENFYVCVQLLRYPYREW